MDERTEALPSARSWEEASRRRLERLVEETVSRMRSTADRIEREAQRNITAAAKDARGHKYHTYPRVVADLLGEVHGLMFNISVSSLVDAAAEAEQAYAEKDR